MSLEPLREALAACDTVLPDDLAGTLVAAIDATRENPVENPLCVLSTEMALLGYRSRQGEVDRLREAAVEPVNLTSGKKIGVGVWDIENRTVPELLQHANDDPDSATSLTLGASLGDPELEGGIVIVKGRENYLAIRAALVAMGAINPARIYTDETGWPVMPGDTDEAGGEWGEIIPSKREPTIAGDQRSVLSPPPGRRDKVWMPWEPQAPGLVHPAKGTRYRRLLAKGAA